MIDAPTNAHRCRATDRSVLVISSGPHGHPAGATGVHARRTATLPEAVGRRQRSSAMFAAKPHEAEQELSKSIPEPRNVTRECRRPVATGDPTCSEPNMEVALERACLLLPTGSEKHRARRIIASKILDCANRGDTTLSRLTGYAGRRDRVTRKERSRRLRPPNSLSLGMERGFFRRCLYDYPPFHG